MKRLAFLPALMVILIARPCLARSNEDNSLHTGAASVQFLPFGSSYFGPSSQQLMFKAHISDRAAILVGTAFSLDESTGKSPSPPLRLQNERYYSIGVSAELQRYVDARGPITVFFALGPFWNRNRSAYEYTSHYLAPDSTTHISYSQSERRSWRIGAFGALGFEWFFKRKLSVLGRIGASFGFGERHDNRFSAYDLADPNYFIRENLNYTTAFSGSSAAALGLAVYF